MKRINLAFRSLLLTFVALQSGCSGSQGPKANNIAPQTLEASDDESSGLTWDETIAALEPDPLDINAGESQESEEPEKKEAKLTKAEKNKIKKCTKAYEKANTFLGTPDEKLEMWNKFVKDFPGDYNQYLEKAEQKIAKYQAASDMHSPSVRRQHKKKERKGWISEEEITETVHKHIGEVEHCYKKQLKDNPNMQGKVWVEFYLSSAGKVVDAELAGSALDNAIVERCIIETMRRWQFPEPKGGDTATITYPFHFVTPEI